MELWLSALISKLQVVTSCQVCHPERACESRDDTIIVTVLLTKADKGKIIGIIDLPLQILAS